MHRLPLFLLALATIAVVFVAVAVFLPSSTTGRDPATSAESPTADTALDDWLESGDFVVAFGEVDVPEGIRQLSLTIPGRIAEVHVHPGDRVAAGQVLLELDQRAQRASLAAAVAAVQEANVQLQQAKIVQDNHRLQLEQQQQVVAAAAANLEVEKRQLERLSSVPDGSAGSILLVEQQRQRVIAQEAMVQVETLKMEQLSKEQPEQLVQAAGAGLDRAKAQRDAAEITLTNTKIHAPVAGTVLRVDVRVGEVLAPAGPGALIQFASDGPRIVRCEVNHRFADRVRPGMRAFCYRDGSEALLAEGTVESVAPWITEQQNPVDRPFRRTDQRTLECIISLESTPADLKVGERLRAVIRTSAPAESTQPVAPDPSPNQARR